MSKSRGPQAAASVRVRDTLVLTGIALALRAVAFVQQPELTYDGTYYLRQAERLSHGHLEMLGFPPGYPLAVWVAHLVARDWVLAGRMVSLLCGTLAVPLAYRWARRLLRPSLAFSGALFLALQPHMARTSVEVLSESLYLVLTLAGVWAFELRRDLLAAGLLGYAFLVRPEAAILAAGLGCLRALQLRRVPWRLLAGLLPIVIYATLSSRVAGHLVLSPKQGQFDPGAESVTRLLTVLQALHASFPVVLVPGAILVAARWHRHLLLPMAYLVTLPLFAIHIQERLFVPALPYVVVLALLWWTGLRPRWRPAVLVISVALFALGSWPGYRNLVHGFELTPHAREIGRKLRPYVQPDDRVAGRFPLVAYYAGAGFVRVPRAAAYPVLVDSVLAAGATHLLVLEGENDHVLPQLRPLFDDARFAGSDGRLVQVAWVDEPVGARAILYRLQPPPLAPERVRVERHGMTGASWMGTLLVQSTPSGNLMLNGEVPPWPSPEGSSEPCADESGNRLVLCQRAGDESWIATLDAATGRVVAWPGTRPDRPTSPTWVGDRVLYVRNAASPGMRALDIRTGRIRDVTIEGVRASDVRPLRVATRGMDVAVIYARSATPAVPDRIIATATWPEGADGEVVELRGRWATQVRLGDDAVCWVPGRDLLVASVRVRPEGFEESAEPDEAALCLVQEGGVLRRLSYGLDRPRRPALRTGEIAYLTGMETMEQAPIELRALQIPPVRVFESATSEPASTR